MILVSTEHDDVPVGKPVRGSLRMLFRFHKLSDNETEVVNVTKFNPNGSLPKMVYGIIANEQLDMFKNYKTVLEKE